MNAVFREICSMSFYGGLLALLVAGTRLLLRRSPKWIHCWLWLLVAVRLVCPSLPQSQLSLAPEPPSYAITAPAVPTETLPVLSIQPNEVPRREEVNPGVLSQLDPPQETPSPIRWTDALPLVWLGGVAVMAVYALWSCRRVKKQVGPSIDIGNGVYLCDYIDSPFLLGLWRPKIYLPSYLDSKTITYVLSHERQHIRRRDHWWKPLGFALLSLHWFNPLIWMAYILLCRDIEMACDEAVIQHFGSQGKQGYSQALLNCSLPRSTISICPLAFGEVSVKERVKSVLNYRRPAFWITALALAALVAGGIFFLTDPVAQEEPEETIAAVETTEVPETQPPYAAELAAMEKDPPRRALDKVEYLPTAIFADHGDWKELDIIEYDKNYRVKKETQYDNGVQELVSTYQYAGNENTLFTTRTITTTARSGRSFSGDGYSIGPRQTMTLTYREKFDKNGNVLEELIYNGNTLTCTNRYTYDENGNLLTSSKDAEDYALRTTYFYDNVGNLKNKWTTVNDFVSKQITTNEQRWVRDENGYLIAFEMYRNGVLQWRDEYTNDADGLPTATYFMTSDHRDKVSRYTWDQARRVKVDITTAADGTAPVRTIYQFDEFGNQIQILNGETVQLEYATNYLGTDGTRSIGIPNEIYDEGIPAETLPAPDLPPVQYQEDELKDACLEALGNFLREPEQSIAITQKYTLTGPTYLPEEVASNIAAQNFTAELIRSGQDYLFTRRSPSGASSSNLSLMRRNLVDYQKAPDGLWEEAAPEIEPMNWVLNYRHHRDDLTFLSDQTVNGVREITYSAAPQHAITYRLKDGVLVGLRETGHLDIYDGYNVDLDFESEVVTQTPSLSQTSELFEKEEKNIRPVAAQPAKPIVSPNDRSAYDQCMNALDGLLAEPYSQVEIQYTTDSPSLIDYKHISWKQGDDFLSEWYSPNAARPHTSLLLMNGKFYRLIAGGWGQALYEPEPQSFHWEQAFAFDLADVDTVRTTADKTSMEIYFHLAPRANVGVKNRTMTFFFQNGTLVSIREAGILTELNEKPAEISYTNEMKLLSTSQWQIQQKFREQEV